MEAREIPFFRSVANQIIPEGPMCCSKEKLCPYWTAMVNRDIGFCGYCELLCAGDIEINYGDNDESGTLTQLIKMCGINL